MDDIAWLLNSYYLKVQIILEGHICTIILPKLNYLNKPLQKVANHIRQRCNLLELITWLKMSSKAKPINEVAFSLEHYRILDFWTRYSRSSRLDSNMFLQCSKLRRRRYLLSPVAEAKTFRIGWALQSKKLRMKEP